MNVASAFFNKVVQVLHVRRDRESLTAAPSLVRLQHAPTLAQFSGERRDIAGGSGSAVQRDDHAWPATVLHDDEIAHRWIINSKSRLAIALKRVATPDTAR
jgi:hypothetical protein